jgi:hypothetical protein
MSKRISRLDKDSSLKASITTINSIINFLEEAGLDKIESVLRLIETNASDGKKSYDEVLGVIFGTPSASKPRGKKLKDYLERMKQELLDAIGGGGGGGITPDELEDLLRDSETIKDLWEIIKKMQGPDWTEDHSIMDNYKRTVIESITPKNIYTEVIGDEAHVVFSYEDNPNISHFVLQYWDETEGKWVNYNGTDGIVPK